MFNDIRGVIEESDGLVTTSRSSQDEPGPPFLRGLQERERRNKDCFPLYQIDDALDALAREIVPHSGPEEWLLAHGSESGQEDRVQRLW